MSGGANPVSAKHTPLSRLAGEPDSSRADEL